MANVLSADVIRAALAQMKPRPCVEMYPGDWYRDPIFGCSAVAKAFWHGAILVMHDAKPYGHLVAANGQPLSEQEIVVRCGVTRREYGKAIAEIESRGIPGRTGDADYRKILAHEPIEIRKTAWTLDLSPLAIQQSGVIYSRRMLRDRILSLVRFLVSPRGQSLIQSLYEGLNHQTPEFDRARAGDARKTKIGDSPVESWDGVGMEREEGATSTPLDFAAMAPVIHKIQSAAFTYPPSDQICIAWIQEYGRELIEETLVDCEPQYRGKAYQYFERILTNRRNNPHERPGNRRARGSGNGAGADRRAETSRGAAEGGTASRGTPSSRFKPRSPDEV